MAKMVLLKSIALATCAMGALATGSIAAPAAHAASPPGEVSYQGDPKSPDIAGLWQGTAVGIPGGEVMSNTGKTADGRPPTFWGPWPLPYTAEYQKIYEDRVAATKKGHAIGDTGSRCLPFGLPSMIVSMHYPAEVVQTPGEVTIYPFGTFPIVIWTDGRGHPADLVPSYNGHSIGHWVGDTLHVDTVGIKPVTPLDSNRDPHSAKLHMTWTIQRVATDVLHVYLTLYDADAFLQPVSITNIWQRKSGPEWQLLDDQSCFENNQTVASPAQAAGFIKF